MCFLILISVSDLYHLTNLPEGIFLILIMVKEFPKYNILVLSYIFQLHNSLNSIMVYPYFLNTKYNKFIMIYRTYLRLSRSIRH